MAWEEFKRNGLEGISGDKPIDEFALVLKKIAGAYEDRFARKPSLHELLYSLEVVISSNPEAYVADADGLALGEIFVDRKGECWNPADYTAYYTEATAPGYHAIGQLRPEEQEVLRIPVLETEGRVLVCEYEIVAGVITDKMVEVLVIQTLLDDYYDRSYRDEADRIKFVEQATKRSWTVSYE